MLLSLLVALMLDAPFKKKKNEQDAVMVSFWRLGWSGRDGELSAVTHGLQWVPAVTAALVQLPWILSCVQ